MDKGTLIANATKKWLHQVTFGLSLSLLASGFVSSLMSKGAIPQNILLFVVSFVGMVISLLCRILPILLSEEEDVKCQ